MFRASPLRWQRFQQVSEDPSEPLQIVGAIRDDRSLHPFVGQRPEQFYYGTGGRDRDLTALQNHELVDPLLEPFGDRVDDQPLGRPRGDVGSSLLFRIYLDRVQQAVPPLADSLHPKNSPNTAKHWLPIAACYHSPPVSPTGSGREAACLPPPTVAAAGLRGGLHAAYASPPSLAPRSLQCLLAAPLRPRHGTPDSVPLSKAAGRPTSRPRDQSSPSARRAWGRDRDPPPSPLSPRKNPKTAEFGQKYYFG